MPKTLPTTLQADELERLLAMPNLEDRREAYDAAELRVTRAAAAYLDARASGATDPAPFTEMDAAQVELRRAKRRLEDTERRLAKRETAA